METYTILASLPIQLPHCKQLSSCPTCLSSGSWSAMSRPLVHHMLCQGQRRQCIRLSQEVRKANLRQLRCLSPSLYQRPWCTKFHSYRFSYFQSPSAEFYRRLGTFRILAQCNAPLRAHLRLTEHACNWTRTNCRNSRLYFHSWKSLKCKERLSLHSLFVQETGRLSVPAGWLCSLPELRALR